MDKDNDHDDTPSITISESSSEEEGEENNGNSEEPSTIKDRIRIDMSSIPCVTLSDAEEDLELHDLGVTAYDQSCYEENVMKQIDSVLDRNDTVQPQAGQEINESVQNILANDNFNEPTTSDTLQRNRDANERFKNSRRADAKRDVSSDDTSSTDEDEWKPCGDESDIDDDDEQVDEEEIVESDESSNREENKKRKKKEKLKKPKKKRKNSDDESKSKNNKKIKDDGNEAYYVKRIKAYKSSLDGEDEYHELEGGLKVPMFIWSKLFPYQQTGVKWLWELHQACVGGIIGDEMGLGKTIQVIAFLAGLKSSKIEMFRETYKSLGPTVIVCPATVMHQWVQELHSWFPPIRVAILHSTGSYSGNKSTLIKNINKAKGILITTYSGVTDYQDMLYSYEWHYVILDEGHKIRNPDAQTTIACKRFRSPHRIILSGSPIQNNLKELWSLFDFVYPGKLGTLPIFMEQFSIPITQGGYANANEVQVTIAFKCATVLKNTIKPYLLRRMKEDVNSTINLPKKNEQVLFCKLTDEQRTLYQTYLDSAAVRDIFRGSPQLFVALINLRKICNHPSLFGGFKGFKKDGKMIEEDIITDDKDYGYYRRSGKMQVVDALLRLWFKQEHKILLFTQGTQMMKIIEKYLNYKNYKYLKMDGSTPIGSRQPLIKQFNEDKSIFIFLLTTRVGGIGVNLIGATRIIIYDPDWNPSTDLQARERAWRIGQDQPVTIYRLLTAGTIEEKIYHRQVFKMYLTNRVLKDPKQRRFFKTNDLYELFTLGSVDSKSQTESEAIFAGTGSDIQVKKEDKTKKSKSKKNKKSSSSIDVPSVTLAPERVQELREQAKRLSQMLASKFASSSNSTSSSSSAPLNSSPSQTMNGTKQNSSTKSKSKKGTIFEGERIKYLVKQDTQKEGEERVSEKQDEYVLKKLFSKSTSVVHSALQHDVIEGTRDADFVIIEKEAEKVASDAIEALKKSRTSCFSASSGIPNWTGLSGFMKKSSTSHKPSSSSSTSSSSLLQAMKQRSRLDNKSNATPETPLVEHEDLLHDLKSFLSFQSKVPGQATTQEILDRFGDRLPPSHSPVFKALLWKLADFFRNSEGVGVWKLKYDFL